MSDVARDFGPRLPEIVEQRGALGNSGQRYHAIAGEDARAAHPDAPDDGVFGARLRLAGRGAASFRYASRGGCVAVDGVAVRVKNKIFTIRSAWSMANESEKKKIGPRLAEIFKAERRASRTDRASLATGALRR